MAESSLTFTDSEKKLLREKNKKLTDTEFEAFLGACRRYQLNPLANQIYARLQPETQKNARQVTYSCQIDGYRLIADRTGQYAGSEAPVYDSEDGPQPKKATVTVHKLVGGEARPYSAPARWTEYYPGGNQGFMWNKMPFLMLGKCAEALALRKAFPAELSGLYTVEEMHQADGDAVEAPKAAPAMATALDAAPQVKKTPEELIRECATPLRLAEMLKKWSLAKPVGVDPEAWSKIIDAADAYQAKQLESGAWKPDDAGVSGDQIIALFKDLATVMESKELLP